MKKLIVVFLMAIVTISCNNNKGSETQNTPNPIGVESPNDSTRISLYGGDMNTTQLWEAYIKAHNEKDLKTIQNINDDSFKGYPPNGDVIDGSKAHIVFLKDWFSKSSPKWTTKYMIANQFTDTKGVLNQWVTSGQDLTDTVEGEEVTLHHVHDVLFVNGKIKMIYVYERATAKE